MKYVWLVTPATLLLLCGLFGYEWWNTCTNPLCQCSPCTCETCLCGKYDLTADINSGNHYVADKMQELIEASSRVHDESSGAAHTKQLGEFIDELESMMITTEDLQECGFADAEKAEQ